MDGTEGTGQGSTPAVESSAPASAGTGASPAPGGLTAAPVTEATSAQPAAPAPLDGVQPAQPIVDQPLEATLQWPNDQELQRMPGQYRDRFGNLKAGYDKLESDHKTLKGQFDPWKVVIDKYGDPAAAVSDLDALSGLRNFKFGEDGNIVFDETTGQPVYDVRPSLEAIVGQNPMMAAHLFDELLTFQDPQSGETMARAFMKALDLNPDRLDDYRNYDPSKQIATSNVGVDPQARADVVNTFGEQYGPVFDALPPELQTELPYMEEPARRALLDRQAAALDDAKFKSALGGATRERGGRRKRIYTITSAGMAMLRAMKETRIDLWKMVPQLKISGT